MIRLNVKPEVVDIHVTAVMRCIRSRYADTESDILKEVKKLGVDSIEEFLKAKPADIRRWVIDEPDKLGFTYFKEIYSKYFSNGADKFVDGDYNAYTFLAMLDVDVCPYCEDEYLDTVEIGGKRKRTSEIDHFFPKSKYPALAMCVYNLVPSGQNCNGLKLENVIGANPHERDIEEKTFLYPDLPVGIAMESVSPKDCAIRFHATNGMEQNVDKFALEQRYERHTNEAYRLLKNAQLYNDVKIDEMVRLGFGTREEIITSIFGPQDPEKKKHELRQKMLRDLTGY